MVIRTEIPNKVNTIVDNAPINQESQSIWLMLAEVGGLLRFDAHSGRSVLVGRIQPAIRIGPGFVCRASLSRDAFRFRITANLLPS